MEPKAKILVIDDEQGIRDLLSYELGLQGYIVATAADGMEGIATIEKEKFDLAILDMKMPKLSGVETLGELKKIDPDIEVIVATGYGTIETAVESMKKGAYDYINKPFSMDELSILIEKILEKKDLKITVALYEASKVMYSSLHLNELLLAVITLVRKIVQADDISIMLYNPDGSLSIAASYNLDGKNKLKTRLRISELVLAGNARTREPVAINNGLETNPLTAGIVTDEKIRSSIVCPLLTMKKTWGAIHVNRIESPDNFTQADVQNIAIFAAQIAQAIENAHLYKDLKNNLNELETAYRQLDEIRMKLEVSNRFVESVIESMTDSFVVINTKGNIIKANQALLDLFIGRKEEDEDRLVLGKSITDFLPVAHIFEHAEPNHFLIRDPVSNLEISIEQAENMTIPLSLSAAPIFDSSGMISGTVIILRNISIQKETEKSLKYIASHDILTGLPNRILLNDRVAQAISRANRYENIIAVLMLDLDRFKDINDTMGHEAGDQLLKEVAFRLKVCLRDYDTVARMGGDEFLVVLCDMQDNDDITLFANRILKAFGKPIPIGNRDIHITTSIGISQYPGDGNTIEVLLKNADIAMYSAKKLNGNTFCFFKSGMGNTSEENIVIKNSLMRALDKNEFVLYYQPLVETDTGKIIAAEALIRWMHPELGLVPPLDFISIAESTGLIIPIGKWVIHTACVQCKKWQDEGFPALPVSVNISARQLNDQDLSNKIIEIVRETGVKPENLILEITESSAMQSIENSIKVIEQLHRCGVRIFLDDFGSGYSSLNWLKVLPVEAIKIDRFFIQHIESDPFDAAIVRAIVLMAHSLNLKVIAEGVENTDQLNFLKSIEYSTNKMLKCDEVQGFLFSRPIPADDFLALLHSRGK